ncbi:MAG: hypothetical protein KDK96_02165 [Chlamydiia bacterium]|nr:hypothetical protein [Chlamydiia bacterium]
MKKVTFLLLGTLMIASGLLVSCQKKGPPCKPAPHCQPQTPPSPDQPQKTSPSSPCQPKKPSPCQPEKKPCGPCRKF